MKLTTLLGHLWLLMRTSDHERQPIYPSLIWKGLYYDDRYLITVLMQQQLARDEDQLRAEFARFLEALCATGLLERQVGRFNAVCPGCLQEQEINLQEGAAICAGCGLTSSSGIWSAEQIYTLVPQGDCMLQKGMPDTGGMQ